MHGSIVKVINSKVYRNGLKILTTTTYLLNFSTCIFVKYVNQELILLITIMISEFTHVIKETEYELNTCFFLIVSDLMVLSIH